MGGGTAGKGHRTEQVGREFLLLSLPHTPQQMLPPTPLNIVPSAWVERLQVCSQSEVWGTLEETSWRC